MKNFFGFVFIGTLLIVSSSFGAVTTDPDITGMGGGVSEGSDVTFGTGTFTNVSAESFQATYTGSSRPALGIGIYGFSKFGSGLAFMASGVGQWNLYPATIQGLVTNNPRINMTSVGDKNTALYTYRGAGGSNDGLGGSADKPVMIVDTVPIQTFELHTTTFFEDGSGQVKISDNGSIEIEGNIVFSGITTIFADYSAINNMNQILCDATAGDIDIHIVSASGTKGRIGNIMKIDASGNDCIIEPAGAETISGAANKTIATRWDNITYFSDNANLLIR